MTTIRRSNCRSCLASCGIIAEIEQSTVVSVKGDPSNLLSRGYLCPKGTNLPWSQHRPDRLDVPLLRGEETTWPKLLDDLAGRVHALIDRCDPDALGWYSGTGLAGDSLGALAMIKLMTALGTRRFYSAVTIDCAPAYKVSQLVSGIFSINPVHLAPRWDIEDPAAMLALVFGCNPAVSHGYLAAIPDPVRRINAFKARGGELFVIDPKRTKTAAIATQHLAIRPGTDRVVLAHLLREVLRRGTVSPDFLADTSPESRRRLMRSVQRYDVAVTAELAGLAESEVARLSDAVVRTGRVAIITGSGVNFQRHGLVTEWLRWVLLLATGSLDGAGGMFITPGWFDALDLRQTPLVDTPVVLPPSRTRPELPRIAGELPSVTLPDDIGAGDVRGLFVAGGNPVSSFPDPDKTSTALRSLDFLAVFDIVAGPTSALATHVVPVAGQLERMALLRYSSRVVASPAVLAPAGLRKPLWWVAAQLGRRLDVDVLDGQDPDTTTEVDLMHAILRVGRHDLGDLMAAGSDGIALPAKTGYLRANVLPNRRWNILPEELLAEWERDDGPARPERAFTFIAGRQLSRNCSTKFVPPEKDRAVPNVTMNPADAARIGAVDGSTVRVRSRHGQLSGQVQVDAAIRDGVVTIPNGWVERNVSQLVSSTADVDPLTGQPAMSAIDVDVELEVG